MDNTDRIAQNFHQIASYYSTNYIVEKINPEQLKKYHLVWDGETVEEIACGSKISEHNWPQKLMKIDKYYKDFLCGKVKETQILVVKDIDYPELLIIDGIHRSVGFYKAYREDSLIISKVDFTYKLFESDRIKDMPDYKRLFSDKIP
jgi:hypothetical protein